MRAINGRLESIILIGFKETFDFRAEIELQADFSSPSVFIGWCFWFSRNERTRERNGNTAFKNTLSHSLN